MIISSFLLQIKQLLDHVSFILELIHKLTGKLLSIVILQLILEANLVHPPLAKLKLLSAGLNSNITTDFIEGDFTIDEAVSG